RQDERKSPPAPRLLMYEMDVHAVQVGAEVMDLVELALLRGPVEPVGPVREDSLQVIEVGALVPPGSGHLIGAARVQDARAQIGEDRGVNLYLERLDAHHAIVPLFTNANN